MRFRVEYLGYAGLLFLAAAGLVRLLFLNSGTVSLVLLVAGIVLFLVYVFRAGLSVQRFLTRRSTREGGNVFFTGLFVLGIVVVANVLVSTLDLQRDVTADKVFTLAPETRSALLAAPVPPKVLVFQPPGTPAAEAIRLMLEAAVLIRPDLEYQVLDPWQEPVLAGKYGLRQYATVVEVGDRFQTFPGVTEEEFTTALIRATRGERLTVGFLRDHGEPLLTDPGERGMARAADALNRRGLGPIYFNAQTAGMDTLNALVIAGPQTDPPGAEIDSVSAYLERGGRVLVLLDPASPITLDSLLAVAGLRFVPRFVRDPDLRDPLVQLPRFSGHPVVAALAQRRIQVVLIGAGGLLDERKPGFAQTRLLWSGPRAVFDGDPPSEEAQAKVFAYAVQWQARPDREARLVVIADSDFVVNRNWETLGNADLFLGAVSWLAEPGKVTDIRPRARTNRPVVLTNQQGRALWVLVVLFLPLMILASGFTVWWKRR